MLKINGITTLSRCDLYLTDKVCDWRIGTWWVSGVFSGELNKMLSVQLSYKTHQFGEAGNKLYEFRDSTALLTLIICKKNNTFIFPMFPWKWEFTGVRSCITLLLQCFIEEMPSPIPQSWVGLAYGVETNVLAPSWMTNYWLHKVKLESTICWIQGGINTYVSSPEA